MKRIGSWLYRIRFQLCVILFIWVGLFQQIQQDKRWEANDTIRNDVAGYYSYLPVYFIRNDLRMNYYHDSLAVHKWEHAPFNSPEGKRYIKYTMGMAYLYAPFFAMATVYAKAKDYPVNGFSKPYQRFLQFSSWFYLLFGLWFLWKYLEYYFNRMAVALTLLLVVFGTNLFYYVTAEAAMPHAYNFTLFAILLYTCHRHALSPGLKKFALIVLLLCLLTLIRPINLLMGFFFFFPHRISIAELKSRLAYVFTLKVILIALAIATLVFLPQLMYWKYVTGYWIFYTYLGETFDFTNPHIINGLFSYKKGWLVYSPLFVFLLPGFYFLYHKSSQLCWSILLFFAVYVYVVFSWWAWAYGGCFGARAMIDIYPVLALPLAAFLHWLMNKRIIYKILLVLPLVFIVYLNIFQTEQYKQGRIHWNGMSKETYWMVFGREDFTDEEVKYLKKKWAEHDTPW